MILALLTRNAVVLSPHPMARECCADAARTLGRAAVEAGAPDGVVQVVDDPSIPLIDALMTDPRTGVILATGGVPVVRAAYSSGNPAIGVGPGNVPVLVDATADLAKAAERLVASKSFDNSVLCTNESVLIVEDSVADRFARELSRQGAHVCTPDERDRVRELLFPDGRYNVGTLGRDATWIAKEAGIRVSPRTRILVAPFELAVDEEPLAHEKLCPVLGMVRVPTAARGIRTAVGVLRIGGAGHSAAVHSSNPATVLAFATAVQVLRVAVNVGSSTGSAGFDTHDPADGARRAHRHDAGPAARLSHQPQQARLDGLAGRVAVRAGDAAGVVRDPRDQRGGEGGAHQGGRLPHDRRDRARLPVRPGGGRATGRGGG